MNSSTGHLPLAFALIGLGALAVYVGIRNPPGGLTALIRTGLNPSGSPVTAGHP